MDRLFQYLGICIWIWASKHSATWHVSGYIPMRCVSRQEAGNIMMVPVISVIPIVLSRSLWMFSVWLVFTSNLNSQATWLKVKRKLVNL